MNQQKIVIAFGEILWDLLPSGAKLGGAPFNFAYRVHSLGECGYIVSRLGDDELGKKAWDHVVQLGMDTRFVQWDESHPTGTVEIELDEQGQPDYHIVPGVAYDHIKMSDGLQQMAAQADCICFGTLIQRTEDSRRTLKQLLDSTNCQWKLLDINLRKQCYTQETITESLAKANLLKLNEEEAYYLADLFEFPERKIPVFCERMIDMWSLSHCLVTLGDRGAFAASAEEKVYAPGYRVPLDDPCGSGDAFTAGFLVDLLGGKPLAQCCTVGNALGAMVARQSGATEPIAPEEILQFIQAGHERVTDERFVKYQ